MLASVLTVMKVLFQQNFSPGPKFSVKAFVPLDQCAQKCKSSSKSFSPDPYSALLYS